MIGFGFRRDVYCGRVGLVFVVTPDVAALVATVVVDSDGEKVGSGKVNHAPRLRAQRTEAMGHWKNAGSRSAFWWTAGVIERDKILRSQIGASL